MLRVRASTLEKFRRLKTYEYVSQGEVINYLKAGQEGIGDYGMAIGSGWHKCLEDPVGTQFNVKRHHVEIEFANAAECSFKETIAFDRAFLLKTLQDLGPGEKEKEYVRTYHHPTWGPVELKGTVDHVHGLEVADFKTKVKSQPKAEDYENSLQWRIYLTLTGGFKFRYWLFPADEPVKEKGAEVPFVYLQDPMVVAFWKYEGMEREVEYALWDFLDWADLHGLVSYLEKK